MSMYKGHSINKDNLKEKKRKSKMTSEFFSINVNSTLFEIGL